MIAVDTNVVAYFVIEGEHTYAAELARAQDGDWLVPPLFRHELLNVLCTYQRAGLLERDDALRTYRRALKLVKQMPEDPDPRRVLRLAEDTGCSAYDAQFVAAAIENNLELVTADLKVVDTFPNLAIELRAFVRLI